MRQPRVAQIVADHLRAEILRGDFDEGAPLPPQDELLRRFEVSLPSIREALGILELEGLVTVRRGNVGGALVHPPNLRSAAYMVTLILESRQAQLTHVAEAIGKTEPVCAALCAERSDRLDTVVPALEASLIELKQVDPDEPVRFNRSARRFHELLVEHCGNEALRVAIGTLVAIWSAHEAAWTEEADLAGRFPGDEIKTNVIKAHKRILDAIQDGDSRTAARLAADHLGAAQTTMQHHSIEGDRRVSSSLLRPGLTSHIR